MFLKTEAYFGVYNVAAVSKKGAFHGIRESFSWGIWLVCGMQEFLQNM